MNRSTASRIPRYHFPAVLAAVDHSAVSNPHTKGATSVGHSVARNSLKSSTMHLCQVLHCPPGFGFSPPVIVPNITRQGNCSLLCRAPPLSKKSRCVRMVVSTLSQRVVVRAFAYERVAGLVSTKLALDAIDSQQDLMVSRPKLDKVFSSDMVLR